MKANIINIIFAFVGGVLSFAYGEISEAFLALILLSIIDFISGITVAYFDKTIDSRVCAKGIAKKVFIYAIIAVAHMIDIACNLNACMNVATFFYIANEGISIIENAGKMGLPIPEKIINVLEQLKSDTDKE